ncbi:N-acetylmuramoyl-L-alanine amidase [Secundilactobacillus malefermentans]|uniref:N-acetylmuramoyl-L-alanine amidase domain-containing protein n=1 Tax=Secundilactobacillus malefermentans TaxID=176292 RepID=A0A4R5NMJ9_9LACO|nr:N-acetylmuramoyl-L-alanine amidase [Secundilactobacillus malefermentans]KRM58451.1 N-acetylmuramoyl-L-alanine amidase [Secundilactobacillus malefermentans DSM 5705 = KCTC 3548]QEA30757.1 N-acetylmuramoyl-L-alanine amidase [Secundilactobacillus malefermentans]TDG75888.1 hypothetical protein C5L31_000664 [Secundilactobacillus malefermentans]
MKKKWHLLITSFAFMGMALLVQTNASASSKVNDYISSQGYSHASITKSIWSGFPKNSYRNGKPEGVVVHETANPSSTIYNEISYMKSNYQNAFVHTFIDASNIINIADTSKLSWGAGPAANARFVQFEQVEVHSKAAFAQEVNNAAYYTAYILNQYGLTPSRATAKAGTIYSHHDVTNYLGGTTHTDPDGYWATAGKNYFGQAYTMTDFVTLVQKKYASLAGSDTSDSSTSSTSSTSNTATNAVTPQKITYYHGYNNETATLKSNYTKYSVYNHVKGTSGAVKIGWQALSADYAGKKVYVDSRGVKSGGWTGTWYRIRFSKASNAPKYWVYSGTLTFPAIKYSNASGTVKIANNTTPLYNHVLNSRFLSKKTGTASTFANKKMTTNQKAIIKNTTWYRIVNGSSTFWIPAAGTTK